MKKETSATIFFRCISCENIITNPKKRDSYSTHYQPAFKIKNKVDLQTMSKWKKIISPNDFSVWRYRKLLSNIDPKNIISLGEGWTPLIHAKRLGKQLGLKSLYIKDERQGPTASFKDRQASLAISFLRNQGINEYALASTGNAGIAYSAYAARAEIQMYVFLPSSVPDEKVREMALYGSKVFKVEGTYDETKKVASKFANRRGITFDQTIKELAGSDSMKTIAFELFEQLEGQTPDWYIQAVSGGIGPIGVTRGFEEMKALGIINKIPSLGIIQSAGCAPMVQAFRAKQSTAKPIKNPETTIPTLSAGYPGRAYEILYNLITHNGGTMSDARDQEAFDTVSLLAQTEGISVEPGTAVAFAGLIKLTQQGIIKPNELVVINCSGHTYPVERKILENYSIKQVHSDFD